MGIDSSLRARVSRVSNLVLVQALCFFKERLARSFVLLPVISSLSAYRASRITMAVSIDSKPTPTLESLAQQIQDLTKSVSTLLQKDGHKEPSFAVDASPVFPMDNDELSATRAQLLEQTKLLHDLVRGPSDHIRETANHVRYKAADVAQHIANTVPEVHRNSRPSLDHKLLHSKTRPARQGYLVC